MNNINKFTNGINIGSGGTGTASGDLTVNSNRLDFHDGSTTVPVLTTTSTDVVTNKSIDANNNTLTNIANAAIAAAAAIALNKLAATTASRALVSDASGFVSAATTTSTEIGYVNGVTSAIQTQLDAKTTKATLTTTGDIYYASSASTPARLGIGSSGDVLTVSAGVPSWQAAGTNITGAMIMYGASSAPTGWLLCNGAAVSRATYAALFAIVSTTFGAGDGSTTFNVPDMRGVFPKGAGTTDRTAGKDASGNFYSATLGTYSTDKLQGHYHSVSDPTHNHSAISTAGSGGGATIASWTVGTASSANNTTFGTTGTSATGLTVTAASDDGTNGTPRTGHTTEPQSLGITYIIKT